MKRTPSLKSAAARRTGASTPEPSGEGAGLYPSIGLTQFAAARAYEFTDTLHQIADQAIDQAQRSIGPMGADALWRRLGPALGATLGFIRNHPLRSGTILALLASAVLLARSPSWPTRR